MQHVLYRTIASLAALTSMLILTSCAQNSLDKPRARVYIPNFADFTYKIAGKVQVKHNYLYGPGAKKCRYVGELDKPYIDDGQLMYPYKTSIMDNFFELNGHVYQSVVNSDREMLGNPLTSRLSGKADPKTGKSEIFIIDMWTFDHFCHSRIGSSEYTIDLIKSSSISIKQNIAQTVRLLSGAWKDYAHWKRPTSVKRGDNTWTVFKKWNRADYLSDAAEYWYFPLGDGSYYYRVIFTYKSAMRARNDDQYLKARAMFDHIIDSFEVRTLTPEESATLTYPTPIEAHPMTQEQKAEWDAKLAKFKRELDAWMRQNTTD